MLTAIVTKVKGKRKGLQLPDVIFLILEKLIERIALLCK